MNTILFALILLVYAPTLILANVSIPPTEKSIIRKTHCEPGDVRRLFGYDCSNMDLKEVPQNLRSSLKVILFYDNFHSNINILACYLNIYDDLLH